MHQATAISNIIALWQYLGKKRRTQFFLLLILMLVAVFAEIISIGAVVPFLTALTKPEALMMITWLQPVIKQLGFQSADELLLAMTLGFVAATVFAAGIRILLLWANTRLSAAMGIQLRSEIYRQTLYQPYEYHVAHNSSELISIVTEKVVSTVHVGIMHVLLLASSLIMSLTIIATLLLISIQVAVLAFVVLGGGYILAGYLVRKQIRRNGNIIAKNQPLAVKCMQEGLGGIRDIIMDNSQSVFVNLYTQVSRNLQLALNQNAFLGGLPKSLLEMLAIVLIAVAAYSLQIDSPGQQTALPVLGALALGAQRLLPSLQQVYFSWSLISGNQAIIADVINQLDPIQPDLDKAKNRSLHLPFNDSIALRNLHFSYAGTNTPVLTDINLNINKGSRIGFIGTTGSGKSTLLDIIMGLLSPTQGQLIVDGTVIDTHSVCAWQNNIAHVPQNIFLADTSIAENIAFGLPLEQINLAQVKRAAEQAQLATYIEGLTEGYRTPVGERGVRLSGGQRQRIGIARALYKQANVIVFDEATSALDDETEASVMEAIEALNRDLTIIIIAHRISTLKGCNEIYRLDKGSIIGPSLYSKITTSSMLS
ncbi:ABC transporter ATP-binding protein [Methylobacter sp. BlB1]|uniref:ABC transporter ATP-binding protein n=1 Tax=Methylobacter sp. BlB1 TaxID=2785914 RepID=UPI001894A889|nr:ABC transporter ATP-binding protein [Methylobacter sp. BlB1]MBF6650308.1 ABC transporter ATP-binding protein [Methylobacter sp. BlB1]